MVTFTFIGIKAESFHHRMSRWTDSHRRLLGIMSGMKRAERMKHVFVDEPSSGKSPPSAIWGKPDWIDDRH